MLQKFYAAAAVAGHIDANGHMRLVFFPKFLSHSEKLRQTRELKKVKLTTHSPNAEQTTFITIPPLATQVPRPQVEAPAEPQTLINDIPIRRVVQPAPERRRSSTQSNIANAVDNMSSRLERDLRMIKQTQSQMANLISALFNQVQELMTALHVSPPDNNQNVSREGRGAARSRGRGRGAIRSTGRGNGIRSQSRANANTLIVPEEEEEEGDEDDLYGEEEDILEDFLEDYNGDPNSLI